MNLKYVKYLKDWIEEKLEKICTITKKKKKEEEEEARGEQREHIRVQRV